MNIIIYPPTIDWTFMKQRPQQLMKQFADLGYIVYYCNLTQHNKPIEPLAANLFLVHDFKRFTQDTLPLISKTVSSIGIWCSWAKLASKLPALNPDWVIYDCVDEFSSLLPYEEEMVRISSAIVCTAHRIYDRLRRTYPEKELVLIPNAYDVTLGVHTSHYPPNNGRQKIGYIGAWAPWVNVRLVSQLARAFPTCEVIIIGVEFDKKFSLYHMENIRYLGHLPHEQLKMHLTSLDVCIIPFKLTPVTLATNPVKMYEYLAAGKPVVSTGLPECMLHQGLIDIAHSGNDFVRKVKERLENPGNPQARVDFALANTWRHRANQAMKLIALL
ncbi:MULTISPECIES: glycosyltransferase [unclassified Sutcliffiella]|uniref:glycosyltransferase n=1 Tax=unclassified Sutcliffiella TaxID=2837532 RepID=UPI0030CC4EF8